MDVVDPRTRSKVVLEGGVGRTARSDFAQTVAPNTLFLLALCFGKAALSDVGVLWSVVQITAVGAIGGFALGLSRGQRLTGKSVEWPVAGLASLLVSIRLCAVLFALTRLSAVRTAIICQFSSVWMLGLLNNVSRPHALFIVAPIALSFLSDASFSVSDFRHTVPGYLALAVEAVSSSTLDHTQGVLLPSLGPFATSVITVTGAFILSSAGYAFTQFLPTTASTESATGFTVHGFAVLMLALAFLYSGPILSKKISLTSSPREVALSYATILVTAAIFGVLPFFPGLGGTDVLTALCLGYGISVNKSRQYMSKSPYNSITQVARSYLKSILSNPESRKIFYFLVLNMCYMLVQMLYGIWTNSLGLISDAIHMAFDCMAIGVGLIASVMARWAPNERFTYGYGRIETLSGFSNGVFLILISIFIVFEAIERLMNPPEMNTSQLLLVSTVGLAVNLFGMFAMGGHHHHGGHSHSHSHGHSHEEPPREASSQGHSHNGHSHSSDPTPVPATHGHSHDHSHDNPHSHSHAHLSVNTELHSSIHSSHSHSSCADGEHHHDHVHEDERCSEDSDTHEKSHLLPADVKSPITPSYNFEYDAHYEHHHASSHGPNLHDHTQIHDPAHEGHSHNMRGVFLHVMADTLGSVGVIISTLLIQFYGWTGFDPIASLFIAILIAASVIPLVIDTGKVLMLDLDHRASGIERALTELHQVDGVASYSSPRFWPKDDSNVIGSIHISVSPSASSHDPSGPHSTVQGHFQQVDRVIERVDSLLRSRISGLEELTVQVEGAPSRSP